MPDASSVDVHALLAADLAGSDVTDGQQEQDGNPPADDPDADPLQRELDAPETPTETTPEETPATEEGDQPETDADEPKDAEENDDDTDTDPVPKGMEDWPKQAVKRIQKQSETIRALKAQVAQEKIVLAPTPTSPLADVTKPADLDQRLTAAKARREWCKANPDGGSIRLENGATYEVDADTVKASLAKAEAEIEAYPDAKIRLAEREKSRPWEEAERIAPGLLTEGTQENTFYRNVLTAVPELAYKLNDCEVFMAAAARGMKMLVEEQEGKAKYVRYELKDGKIVPPKQPQVAGKSTATSPANAGKPAAAKPQAQPFRPTNQRPALRAAGATPSADFAALEAKAAAGDPAAVKALFNAELAAA